MDLNLLQNLIGNLDLGFDFSRHNSSVNSPHAHSKQKNKLKNGTQIVVNINGMPAETRDVPEESTKGFAKGYCAVFLTNNQVYFGKMTRPRAGQQFIALKDVYYLRELNDDEVVSIDLVQLGSELHAPEAVMHINLSAVLFWERITDDGPIVTAIGNYHDADSRS